MVSVFNIETRDIKFKILSVRYKEIQNKLKKFRSSFEKKIPKKPF